MTLFVERRRPALTGELLLRVLLAWAMIAALLLVTSLPSIQSHRFPDPDDALRLVQVRDLMAGQGWFDLTQHRIDAVRGGLTMGGSRLVDIPLAAVILALRGLIGQGAAETVAMVAVPLLTFGVALLLAARIAWRVIGDEAAGFACLAMGLSAPLVQQLRPMRIDHHGWEVVCVLAAMNGLMARSARLGGSVTGLALAAGLSISTEGVTLAAAICGVTALRWLRERGDAAWFVATMQGLAAGSLGFFAVTRGFAGSAEYCDAISPAHLAGLGAAALAATGLARLEPMPRFALVIGIGAVAGIGAATMVALAPQCTGVAPAPLDPLVARLWTGGPGDGLPIWRQDAALALQIAVPPLVGLLACFRLAGRSSGWLRRFWQEYAIVLGVALAVALFVARAGAAAGALAAVPLGWQVREWLRSSRMLRRPGKRALVLTSMSLSLLPALPLMLFALAMPAQAAGAVHPVYAHDCAISVNSVALRSLPPGEILAPLEIGPQILLESGHLVVATGHRREQAAMGTVIGTFTGSPEAAQAALAARGTRYVAICPGIHEAARYAGAAPAGLMARLLGGHAPQWLEPVQASGDGKLEIWRVRR
ncbi:hypothetical protein GCM10011515_25550 [Tsuneonella deserti]|uniref:Glycosyltransferase RgtA/B/C/D-like domain-containing protein n=1 Tax=Tsuneonella deserti TaxID=2035528 RepID=A0ABQ1SDY9_9SPHN|nr:hypothetical protein [Tsuneonella deserti]GGE04841.1 hypothetical protein GCM10011515_25550 [Tsuneonella deserti]